MATITKRNDKYCVVYYYTDNNGRKKQKWETCATLKEAKSRKTTIEYEMDRGTFVAPSTDTVESFLNTFIELYGYQKWSVNTLARNRSKIEHYILPYIGDKKIQDIKPIVIEEYYQTLRKQKSTRAQRANKDEKVSSNTMQSIHKLLSCAFDCAVKWDLVTSNPFKKVTAPHHEYAKREIWTSDMIAKALEACEDPKISLAIQLSFACSLRLGEVLGLQWKNVYIEDEDIESGNARIVVDRQLQRLSKQCIEELGSNSTDILFSFPPVSGREDNTSVLVLKNPKTKSSQRTVWLPGTLAEFLQEWRKLQNQYREFFKDEYHNYDMVVSFEDGRPVEHNIIRDGLEMIADAAGLPHVVFHSLRHSSTTYKLKLNNGDIKATQGDTGHAQSDIITDLYSHILDEDRKINAQKFDAKFYQNEHKERVYEKEKKIDVDGLVKSIKEDPELLEKLLKSLQ